MVPWVPDAELAVFMQEDPGLVWISTGTPFGCALDRSPAHEVLSEDRLVGVAGTSPLSGAYVGIALYHGRDRTQLVELPSSAAASHSRPGRSVSDLLPSPRHANPIGHLDRCRLVVAPWPNTVRKYESSREKTHACPSALSADWRSVAVLRLAKDTTPI